MEQALCVNIDLALAVCVCVRRWVSMARWILRNGADIRLQHGARRCNDERIAVASLVTAQSWAANDKCKVRKLYAKRWTDEMLNFLSWATSSFSLFTSFCCRRFDEIKRRAFEITERIFALIKSFADFVTSTFYRANILTNHCLKLPKETHTHRHTR